MNGMLLSPLIGLVAFLYAFVGHAGASGYLALGLSAGMAPAVIKSQALVLNLFVGSLSAFFFTRAGYLKLRPLLWLLLGSVPAAYFAARIPLAPQVYRYMVALALAFAASKLLFQRMEPQKRSLPTGPLLSVLGFGVGLMAGLSGTGGGIFLSPILYLAGYLSLQECSAIAAYFILCNSLAGLAGAGSHALVMPPTAWILAALYGGGMGAWAGSRHLQSRPLRLGLAAVLGLATLKLVL
jgi:uncharacterized membrane protein YfcA